MKHYKTYTGIYLELARGTNYGALIDKLPVKRYLEIYANLTTQKETEWYYNNLELLTDQKGKVKPLNNYITYIY